MKPSKKDPHWTARGSRSIIGNDPEQICGITLSGLKLNRDQPGEGKSTILKSLRPKKGPKTWLEKMPWWPQKAGQKRARTCLNNCQPLLRAQADKNQVHALNISSPRYVG